MSDYQEVLEQLVANSMLVGFGRGRNQAVEYLITELKKFPDDSLVRDVLTRCAHDILGMELPNE